MNVFEVVKENVTARQAAEAYGLKEGRTGMACCPFHSDKDVYKRQLIPLCHPASAMGLNQIQIHRFQ